MYRIESPYHLIPESTSTDIFKRNGKKRLRKNDGSLNDWIKEGEMYPITEHIAQAPSVEHILHVNLFNIDYTKEVSIATCFVTIAANFILLGYLMLYRCCSYGFRMSLSNITSFTTKISSLNIHQPRDSVETSSVCFEDDEIDCRTLGR